MTQDPPPPERGFTLRPAQQKDVQGIIDVGSKVFSASFGYSLPAADLEKYLETSYNTTAISAEISNPDMDIIVACDEGDHVIGFVQLTQGTFEECIADCERPVELQRLYVSQAYHGCGVGRALTTEVEEMARRMGFKTMWLGVWEENLKAQKVYERLGFKRVGVHDFVMGSCVQRDWILRKGL